MNDAKNSWRSVERMIALTSLAIVVANAIFTAGINWGRLPAVERRINDLEAQIRQFDNRYAMQKLVDAQYVDIQRQLADIKIDVKSVLGHAQRRSAFDTNDEVMAALNAIWRQQKATNDRVTKLERDREHP